jgi:hypothetical protein
MCHCDIPYQICFYIACPCHILGWIILLMVTGFLITGRILIIASKFYFYTLQVKQPPDLTVEEQHPISVIWDLELWLSYDRFATMIAGLSDKMKDTIRWGLRFDFLFMFFTYGAMYLLVRLITHCHYQTAAWSEVWRFALCLPLLAWIMDILENIWTAIILNNISKSKAYFQRTFSVLKWLAVFIWFGVWIVYVVSLLR